MSLSKAQIREIAAGFGDAPERAVDECVRITDVLQRELDKCEGLGVHPEPYSGGIECNGDSSGHMFLILPETEIEGAMDGPVIIDGSIQQFCRENYEQGDVDVNVEACITLPENVGIFSPSDEEFKIYNF